MLLALALLLAAVGCGPNEITTGVVVRKDHALARDGVSLQPAAVNGAVWYVPQPVHAPESWSITIRTCEPDDPGRCETRTVEVDPATYERTPLGSTYHIPEGT
jgi:hypothetical protein